MANFITGVIIRKDTFLFAEAPQTVQLNCIGLKVIDIGWATPIKGPGGIVNDYLKILIPQSKPTLDSIRILIVESEGSIYWIVLTDDGTTDTLVSRCNGCCGSTPVMPAVVIPPPLNEICPCLDAGGTTRTFVWPLPYNPNALAMMLYGTFDGVAGTPPYSGGGLANGAAVLAYLLANWTAYGTWTLTSGVLKLVSTTVKCASMYFPIIPAVYCFSFPVGTTTADSIVIGSSTVMFPGGAITFSSADPMGLQYVLSQLLSGSTIGLTTGSPSKLTYTGLQVPVKLQNAGVDVSGGAFTAGACSWTFNFDIPADIGVYSVTQPSFNGVVGVPDITGTTFATAAIMLTWFNTNMSAYGTWSLQSGSTILRLVSATTYTATNLTITSA